VGVAYKNFWSLNVDEVWTHIRVGNQVNLESLMPFIKKALDNINYIKMINNNQKDKQNV